MNSKLAGRVELNLSTKVDKSILLSTTLPESHARELAKAPPELQAEIYKEAQNAAEFDRESNGTEEYKPMATLHFSEAFDYDSQRKAFLFEAREADRPFTCVLPIAEVGARFHTQSEAETEQAFRSNFPAVQTATQTAFQRHGADTNGELLVTLM